MVCGCCGGADAIRDRNAERYGILRRRIASALRSLGGVDGGACEFAALAPDDLSLTAMWLRGITMGHAAWITGRAVSAMDCGRGGRRCSAGSLWCCARQCDADAGVSRTIIRRAQHMENRLEVNGESCRTTDSQVACWVA